jgi:general secretion pathway protein E
VSLSLSGWTPCVLAVYCLLAVVDGAQAAPPSFPRGPGFYYSNFKLGVAIATFLGWVALCGWVNADALGQKLDGNQWNAGMLVAGLVGFILMWMMPSFLASWLLFWILVGAALYSYIHYRDGRAHETERVVSREMLEHVLARYLHIKMGPRAGKQKGPGVPVKIIKRSGTGGEQDVTRVQHSKGYRAAMQMIFEGVNARATDIHLEPTADEMSVRYRIDGIMTNSSPYTRATGDAVVNLLKVICNLDITEKRKPQDGSFSAQVGPSMVEFRVATAGTASGEKMVMRLLDYSQAMADLSRIGMNDSMREQIHELVTRPHGLFLVCGPTGSGKSTTLYACLHEIDRFQQNVITVENPVEYRLDNVTQIEINPKAGKTFASELRSILRQDPDVIMIGEIRDKETAEIACQAAQTGHMVLSTIHANDTITALGRLLDLGVQPYQVSAALNAVLGQRLVRRLCKTCRQKYKPGADVLKKLQVDANRVRVLYKPTEAAEDDEERCEDCGGHGYLKRTGVFELFVLTDKIREMMRENPNIQQIKQEASKAGLVNLYQYGTELVLDGTTSLQELLRVCKS